GNKTEFVYLDSLNIKSIFKCFLRKITLQLPSNHEQYFFFVTDTSSISSKVTHKKHILVS
ncbi:unnamed protein product, partial [Brassica oleracea var. botrytis]